MIPLLARIRVLVVTLMALGALASSCGDSEADYVDWPGAIEATRSIATFEGEFAMGVSDGRTSQSLIVVTAIDEQRDVVRSVIESGGERQAEVIAMGETSWFRFEDPSFQRLLPQGVRFVEIATDDLVSAGVISLDSNVTWAPLYMLLGAHSTELLSKSEGARIYESSIDVSRIEAALPDAVRPAFTATLADFLQPEAFESVMAETTLDSEDRIVQFALTARLNPATTGANDDATLSIRLSISGIDVPVAVHAPDAAAVTHVDAIPGLRDSLNGPGPGF